MNNKAKYGVILLILCGMAGASIGICANTPGVFYEAVSADLGIYRGTFALHATLSLIGTAVMSLYVPNIMKKIPIRIQIAIGSALMILTTFFMSMAKEVLLFYCLGLLRGIGAGMCANVPITLIVNKWFHKKNGTATSIALCFSGLSGAICSPLLAKAITGLGWRSGYRLQALMILVFMLPALLIPFNTDPAHEGYIPYGYEKNEKALKKSNKSSKSHFSFLCVPFIALSLMAFLHTSITGLSQHISGYATSFGYQASFGAIMLSAMMIGNILMKLVIGVLSDRIGAVRSCIVMIITNIFSLLMIYSGARLHIRLLMLAGAFLFGSVYAVGAVGIALVCRETFGNENFGKAYPKLSFLISMGSASSLPLIGYVYDFTGDYSPVLFIAIGFHLVNMSLMIISTKWKSLSPDIKKIYSKDIKFKSVS